MLIIATLVFVVLSLVFSTIWIHSLSKRIQLLEAVAIEMFLLLKSSHKLTEENATYINELWMTHISNDKENKRPFTIN
jgi:hypothetical protein